MNKYNRFKQASKEFKELSYIHDLLFSGMRKDPKIDKEVLILTDGQSNCGGDISSAVEKLKTRARVFALLIGDGTPEGLEEMTSYVSTPVQDHLFAIKNYNELDSLLQMIQSQSQPCIPLDIPQQN